MNKRLKELEEKIKEIIIPDEQTTCGCSCHSSGIPKLITLFASELKEERANNEALFAVKESRFKKLLKKEKLELLEEIMEKEEAVTYKKDDGHGWAIPADELITRRDSLKKEIEGTKC